MGNRNTRFKIIGAVIVLALLIGLLLLVNSSPDINPQKSYKIEIYHCPQIVSDEVLLRSEIFELLKSTELPSSNGFIAPIVQLHEKLNGGDLKEIRVPMTGLSRLREFLNEDYYDFLVRKSEEEDLLEKLFASDNYNEFKAKALLQGDVTVNSVPYDQGNCVTEFFINANQSFTNSSDNKTWNSLASLKFYINSLIAANKIASGSIIKIYYQCGVAPPPMLTDSDGDGYFAIKDCDDNDARINSGAVEICGDSKDNNCDGRIDEGCSIPPSNIGPNLPFNAGLLCKDYSNSPSWNSIPGANKITLSVEVEVEGKRTDENNEPYFSGDFILNGGAKSYSFGGLGGLNKTKKFRIKLSAKDTNGNDIDLINNSLSGVQFDCSN